MGCCCSKGTSDVEDLENDIEPKPGKFTKHIAKKSWHDKMTLKEKKKFAKEHQAHECFLCKCCGIFGAWSGLQCCCCHFNADEPLLSVRESRHCTDVPCCLLFIVSLAAQLGLAVYSWTQLDADPRWLLYYADYNGQLCAPDIDFNFDLDEYVSDYTSYFNTSLSSLEFNLLNNTAGNYAAWPDIRMYDIIVCVDHCNDTLVDPRIVTPSFDSDINNVDVDSNGVTLDISGYSTINFFDIVCVPDPALVTDIVAADMSDYYDTFSNAFDNLSEAINLAWSDIQIAAPILYVLCIVLALFVSMTWGCCIRWFGGIIIWCSIIITIIAAALLAYGMVEYSAYAYGFGYDTIGDIMYYGGYVLGILVGMFALAIIFMWNRIRLAIALSKETTRALTDSLGLFLYPIFPFIVFLIYLVYWIIGAMFMYSVVIEVETPFPDYYTEPYYTGGPSLQSKLGLPDEDATYTQLEVDETWQYLTLAHFFMLLWVKTFIEYHTYMVMAGVFAEWYFADWKDKSETKKWRGTDEEVLVVNDRVVRTETELDRAKDKFKNKLEAAVDEEFHTKDQDVSGAKMKEELKKIAKFSRWPVCGSLWRVSWNHMGTIAFASLLIAIIDFIEKTLTYFEKKFRNGEPSPVQKALLAMIKCVLRCVKCILNRINKNGLIICSIYGWPFCASSMKGIMVITKNIIRASALSMVSGYLEKLGKIAIVCLNMALCMMFAVYYYDGDNQMTSLLFPGAVCLVITVTICWHYMNLYEVGLSTIFICFLIDEERNKAAHEMKASHRLRTIIGATKPTRRYMLERAQSTRTEGLMSQEQRDHFGSEELDDRDHEVMHRDLTVHLDSKHGPETSRTLSLDSDKKPEQEVITPAPDDGGADIQLTMQQKMRT